MQEMAENVYFECRKKAAEQNDKLRSRAGAAELLGVSESTLAHYELGVVKNVPVDIVVLMAELYKAPELKRYYCKRECPIGKDFPVADEAGSLEGAVLRMVFSLDEGTIRLASKALMELAKDGKITPDEVGTLETAMKALEGVAKSFSELRVVQERAKLEKGRCEGC